MASLTLERGPGLEVGERETLALLGGGFSLPETEPRPVLLSLPLGASSRLPRRPRCFRTTTLQLPFPQRSTRQQ